MSKKTTLYLEWVIKLGSFGSFILMWRVNYYSTLYEIKYYKMKNASKNVNCCLKFIITNLLYFHYSFTTKIHSPLKVLYFSYGFIESSFSSFIFYKFYRFGPNNFSYVHFVLLIFHIFHNDTCIFMWESILVPWFFIFTYLVPIILVTIHFDPFIYHIFHNDPIVLHVYILVLNFIFFNVS
jgi:hypothetical protein